MTSKEFVSWLSGYFDALGELTPSPSDVKNIRKKILEIKDSEKVEFGALHRIPTLPYVSPSTPSPDWRTPIGDVPPFGGTTLTYDYRSTGSNEEINQESNVDKKHNSKN
jgi:hypothetical protein